MVCFDIPSSRPTSAALRPASICFNAPIISTSLYFLFAMPPPLRNMRYSYTPLRGFWGTGHSGAVVARYSQTQNIDEPLAMLRSGATSYYHADGLGSVSSLSNAAGSIANTYTYDSFGKQTNSTGSLVNPFRYTARESDTETGLYYYRSRYY